MSYSGGSWEIVWDETLFCRCHCVACWGTTMTWSVCGSAFVDGDVGAEGVVGGARVYYGITVFGMRVYNVSCVDIII